jgi:hypothetical protein
MIDPAHRHGAGHVPATVATIIKVLSPVQFEYAARRRWSMVPKTQLQDHHLPMILINRGPVQRSGRGKDA